MDGWSGRAVLSLAPAQHSSRLNRRTREAVKAGVLSAQQRTLTVQAMVVTLIAAQARKRCNYAPFDR